MDCWHDMSVCAIPNGIRISNLFYFQFTITTAETENVLCKTCQKTSSVCKIHTLFTFYNISIAVIELNFWHLRLRVDIFRKLNVYEIAYQHFADLVDTDNKVVKTSKPS